MGFKNDFNQAQQSGGLKPEGDYECIIMSIEEKQTKSGKSYLNFTLVIRNDVQGQRYGNACLFHSMWKKTIPNENDMQVNGYSYALLMSIGKAAQLSEGKEYDTLKQYCEDLLKKCVRVTLEHKSDPKYNEGKPQERISYFNPTKFPQCHHKFKQAQQTANGYAASSQQFAGSQSDKFADYEISDDGVPF